MASRTVTDYHAYASALCDKHDTEHIVSGRTRDKKLLGRLKDSLLKALREDWPGCKLQPQAVHSGTDTGVETEHMTWQWTVVTHGK